jgi:hypothetical protein
MSEVAEVRYGVEDIPAIDMDDPGMVEAWFAPGSYSHYEHYRKVVLAQCKELIRAKASVAGEKLSETRIDDLSRLHDNYLSYLKDSLEGRSIRETMVRQRMGV